MEVPWVKKRKKEGSASNYSPQDDCGPQPTAQPPPEPSPGVGTAQGKWKLLLQSQHRLTPHTRSLCMDLRMPDAISLSPARQLNMWACPRIFTSGQ